MILNPGSLISSTSRVTLSFSPSSPSRQVLEQATERALEDLIVIALETGNYEKARSRFAEAQEVLSQTALARLFRLALNEYGVTLA